MFEVLDFPIEIKDPGVNAVKIDFDTTVDIAYKNVFFSYTKTEDQVVICLEQQNRWGQQRMTCTRDSPREKNN